MAAYTPSEARQSDLARLRRRIGDIVIPVRAAIEVPTAVVVSFWCRTAGGYLHVWCSDNIRPRMTADLRALAHQLPAGCELAADLLPELADLGPALQGLRAAGGGVDGAPDAPLQYFQAFPDPAARAGGALRALAARVQAEERPATGTTWSHAIAPRPHGDTPIPEGADVPTLAFLTIWNEMKRACREDLSLPERYVLPIAPLGILQGAITVFVASSARGVCERFLAVTPQLAALFQSVREQMGRRVIHQARAGLARDWPRLLVALGYFSPALRDLALELVTPTKAEGLFWHRFGAEGTEDGDHTESEREALELSGMDGTRATLRWTAVLPAGVGRVAPLISHARQAIEDGIRHWWSLATSDTTATAVTADPPEVVGFETIAEVVGPSRAPALILGASGTGKERVARLLHTVGGESRAFVPLNCAASPPNVVVAELLGYAKGAYTDAKEARAGAIERAEGGTLFLDEVADLPPAGQGALLRMLDGHGFSRVGEPERTRHPIVRVIAATNKLETLHNPRRFRPDLLARLSTWVLHTIDGISAAPELACIAAQERLEEISRDQGMAGGVMLMSASAAIARLTREGLFDSIGNLRAVRAALDRAYGLARAEAEGVPDSPILVTAEHVVAACKAPWLVPLARPQPRPTRSSSARVTFDPRHPETFLALSPSERKAELEQRVHASKRDLIEQPALVGSEVLRAIALLANQCGGNQSATHRALDNWRSFAEVSTVLRHAHEIGLVPRLRSRAGSAE